jgi:gas vesicle structural protein
MQPTREQKVTLNDLLDRVLDKGLVLNADLLITVAGVPLLAVSLSAVLAGVETMNKYGLFTQWDKEIRREESRRQGALTSQAPTANQELKTI